MHTERTHVRNLKIIEQLFHEPMRQRQIATPDVLEAIFGNLPQVLQLHAAFNDMLKRAAIKWREDFRKYIYPFEFIFAG